jgi:tetratricopeptide (TPR) repeat protein
MEERAMHGSLVRRVLHGSLMAAVWGVLALAVLAAEDASPIQFKIPKAAAENSGDAPSAPNEPPSTASEKPKGEPTLAPPRRNVLREAKDAKPTPTPLREPGPIPPPGDGQEKALKAPERLPAGTADAAPAVRGSAASPTKEPVSSKEPAGEASVSSPEAPGTPSVAPKAKPVQPVPEPLPADSTEIEAATFNGVSPGTSTLEEVEKAWGKPKETRTQDDLLVHQYRVEPFERVDVVYANNKVASIVIRLEKSFPAEGVARQLELSGLQPVLISNELGEILGQVYPERGVVFSFEPSTTPGKPTMRVSQIVLEPITAEPFLLRAETHLDNRLEASLKDLDQALKLSPNHARAHWLRARLLAIQGDHRRAMAASDEAVRLAPKDAQFRVTRAQILGQLGRFDEAIQEAEKAVADSQERPHVKARALCLLGDLLGSGPHPDYKKAVERHTEAVKLADTLITSPHPAIRLPAKEVLIDAHLGAAHDIAWGTWNQKQVAVPVWLKRASAFAEELIQNDGGTAEHRFRVATRALAACVGAKGQIDPAEWTEQVVQAGHELSAKVDPSRKPQVQWEMGLALYDAVQVYQMRGDRELALKYGAQATALLESGSQGKPKDSADRYLLGRLYFRLGSIHAIMGQDHRQAVTWFDKAVPIFEESSANLGDSERGRLGETLVSMAVSYWETGQRDRAVQLTEQGVKNMEQAVKSGVMQASALEIPQANLATMQRSLASPSRSDKASGRSDPVQKATKRTGTIQR